MWLLHLISVVNPCVVIAEQTVSFTIALKEHLDNNSVLSTQALEAYDYGIGVCSLNFNFHNSTSADIHFIQCLWSIFRQ